MANIKDKKPIVTIAIPTYNRSSYLIKAIESALQQTYIEIEVIISNNASIDNTIEELAKFNDNRLVIINHKEKINMDENWNACLGIAKGDYFMLLSDDDYLESTAIETFLEHFYSDDIGIVYCQTKIVDESNNTIAFSKTAPLIEPSIEMLLNFLNWKREVYPCSLMFRTTDLKKLGGYNGSKYSLALDTAAWVEIAIKRGKVAYVNRVLSNYRIHNLNIGSQTKIEEWEYGLSSLILMCQEILEKEFSKLQVDDVVKYGKKYKKRLIVSSLTSLVRKGVSRKQVLSLYFKHRSSFIGMTGMYLLLISIMKLCMPHKLFYTIKKIASSARV
ncbi:glycosyltransferase [Paenibacillus sp. V4I7]|uniref:glycosyltransferase family 2 protein n=1 Tax=Paenibacillus sp. V4I7 TaxID=3042307 RepID=UPI0027832E68|nr:glycosyltransferase [Paenibacillus sp. V4I7]MDQ0903915.1 glycosyltransferase involved in cell wall biosynthesis [Paenibacillus sp. V4I7]